MQITIEASQPLTATEKDMLRLLLGEKAPEAALPASEPKPAPKVAKTAPKPEKAAQAAKSDLREEAAKLGQQLVSEGKADQVRAALKSTGAKRVTEIPEDRLPAFLKELNQ